MTYLNTFGYSPSLRMVTRCHARKTRMSVLQIDKKMEAISGYGTLYKRCRCSPSITSPCLADNVFVHQLWKSSLLLSSFWALLVFLDDVPLGFLVALPALLFDAFAPGTFPLEFVLANAVGFVDWAFLELPLMVVGPADDCCMIDDGRCWNMNWSIKWILHWFCNLQVRFLTLFCSIKRLTASRSFWFLLLMVVCTGLLASSQK